ncbi:MAG: HAD-IIIA family hydrolase [bacterium]
MTTLDATIVVPSIGRPSLQRLLESLAAADGPRPVTIVLVDDRRHASGPLLQGDLPGWTGDCTTVAASGGRGPAAARNAGWRTAATAWIAFLDDDVLVEQSWLADLATDLADAPDDLGGSQGRVNVPLPSERRPTDWERGTAGLMTSRWITADMAYRRSVLAEVDGFDERFPRAFREDADLALRVMDAGYGLALGRRAIVHPVRPAPWRASLSQQRGNADDPLMRRLHGPGWARTAQAPPGRRTRHAAVTGAAVVAGAAALTGHRRSAGLTALAWLAGTAEFAWARIGPGPRDAGEVARMVTTSVAIPPAAVYHWLRGVVRHHDAGAWRPPAAEPGAVSPETGPSGYTDTGLAAVLIDRDGTIVRDVPYNGDPNQVQPMDGARAALDRLRAAGLPLAVITNQSGVGTGRLTRAQVDAVNARVEELLGPFDLWLVCPHSADDGCRCRKPQPGLVLDAAAGLGVSAQRCAVIGDIGSDVQAAAAAGALGVLVPTEHTRREEIRAAPVVAANLGRAVDHLLAAR